MGKRYCDVPLPLLAPEPLEPVAPDEEEPLGGVVCELEPGLGVSVPNAPRLSLAGGCVAEEDELLPVAPPLLPLPDGEPGVAELPDPLGLPGLVLLPGLVAPPGVLPERPMPPSSPQPPSASRTAAVMTPKCNLCIRISLTC